MKAFALLQLVLVLAASACGSAPPAPSQIVEVTRVVTVAPTPTPAVTPTSAATPTLVPTVVPSPTPDTRILMGDASSSDARLRPGDLSADPSLEAGKYFLDAGKNWCLGDFLSPLTSEDIVDLGVTWSGYDLCNAYGSWFGKGTTRQPAMPDTLGVHIIFTPSSEYAMKVLAASAASLKMWDPQTKEVDPGFQVGDKTTLRVGPYSDGSSVVYYMNFVYRNAAVAVYGWVAVDHDSPSAITYIESVARIVLAKLEKLPLGPSG